MRNTDTSKVQFISETPLFDKGKILPHRTGLRETLSQEFYRSPAYVKQPARSTLLFWNITARMIVDEQRKAAENRHKTTGTTTWRLAREFSDWMLNRKIPPVRVASTTRVCEQRRVRRPDIRVLYE